MTLIYFLLFYISYIADLPPRTVLPPPLTLVRHRKRVPTMSAVLVHSRLTQDRCWILNLPDEVLAHIIEEYLGFKAHLCLMTTCWKLNIFTTKLTHSIAISLNAYIVDQIDEVDEQLSDCVNRMFDIQCAMSFARPKDKFSYVSTRLQILVKQSNKIAEKANMYKMLVLNKNWKKHLCAISKMDMQFDKLDNNVCSLAMDVKELENSLEDTGYITGNDTYDGSDTEE